MSIQNIRLEVMQLLEKNVSSYVDQYLIPVEKIMSAKIPTVKDCRFLNPPEKEDNMLRKIRINPITPKEA